MNVGLETWVSWTVRLGAVSGAAALGFVATRSPGLALAAVAAIGLVALMLLNAKAALLVLIALSYFDDLLIDLAGGLPVVKGLGSIVIVGWLLRRLVARGRRPFRVGKVEVAMGVLAGVLLLSVTGAVDPSLARTVFIRYVLFMTLAIAIADQMDSPRDIRNVAWALIIGASVAAPVGLAFFLTGAVYRASGPLEQPNDFAFVLSLALVFGFFILRTVNGSLRVLLVISMLVMAAAMLATFSRGTVVGLAVGFAWGLAQGKVQIRYVFATLLAILAVVAGIYLANREHLETSFRMKYNWSGVTIDKRTDRWSAAVRMIADKPLLGVGPGSYRLLLPAYAGLGGVDEEVDVSHNMYIEVAAESGLLGGAAFLVVMGLGVLITLQNVSFLSRFSRLRRRARDGPDDDLDEELRGAADLADAVAVGLLAVLAAAMFSTKQYQPPLWILLGLAIALNRMLTQKEIEIPPAPDPSAPALTNGEGGWDRVVLGP